MKQAISIGIQDFESLRQNQWFYVDKSRFIREWWNEADTVTLITARIVLPISLPTSTKLLQIL